MFRQKFCGGKTTPNCVAVTSPKHRKSCSSLWERFFLRRIAAVVLALPLLWLLACAKNDDTTQAASIVFAYAHSADYSTYKLDLIENRGSTFSAKLNQITVNSSGGLRSPTVYGNYLLLVDSSLTGRLLAYDKNSLALAGQINVGSFPQDMVVLNGTAYIANGATGTNLLKRVNVASLPAMTALSDITVGNQPSAVRYYNGKIYVANQDWLNKTQATVSVVNPTTNTVEATFNTGPNNMDIAFDGTRVWTYNADWYDGNYVCQNAASLTYAPVSTHTPANITPPAPYDTNSNCAKSGLAFNNNGGFTLLRHSSGHFHLFSITGTTLNTTPVDSSNRYTFVGNGTSYLYKVHNGDGSSSNLTVLIEDLAGTQLASTTLTKDTDMYFFVMQ